MRRGLDPVWWTVSESGYDAAKEESSKPAGGLTASDATRTFDCKFIERQIIADER